MKKNYTRHSKEFRTKCVKQAKNYDSLSEAARALKVSMPTLYGWVQKDKKSRAQLEDAIESAAGPTGAVSNDFVSVANKPKATDPKGEETSFLRQKISELEGDLLALKKALSILGGE